jgi:hypothetical protein
LFIPSFSSEVRRVLIGLVLIGLERAYVDKLEKDVPPIRILPGDGCRAGG